ncbi:DsbA family protein [Patescibacteria group bacterium]|jgi:protein-disulfide isomerase|nr:DsbA family protein [Patescibacteria group bacterium]
MEEQNIVNPQAEKEARKEAQRKADRARAMKAKFGRIARIGAAVLGVVIAIGGLIYLAERNDVDQPSPLSGEVTAADHVIGNENASVTIFEYADFQCPACASYHPVIKQVLAQYPEDVRVVFRHFPLRTIHPNAEGASRAAEAAGNQGKFFEMHDLLFNNQTRWSNLPNPTSTFEEYALSLGLDMDKYQADFSSGEVRARVQADVESGIRANVTGTPTFFINGTPINSPRGLDGFITEIEKALGR